MICLSASLVFWWAWAVYGAPIFVVLDKLDVLDGRLRSLSLSKGRRVSKGGEMENQQQRPISPPFDRELHTVVTTALDLLADRLPDGSFPAWPSHEQPLQD